MMANMRFLTGVVVALLIATSATANADNKAAARDAYRKGVRYYELGEYQDALNAFRKARQHDPLDRSLDVAIDSAQRGIVSQFLNRYRR